MLKSFDAVVIGAGFYGSLIASYLCDDLKLQSVVLIDRETEPLARASFYNQARVHGGYHYPRSFTTAYRSRANLTKFLKDWPDAIVAGVSHLYGISKNNSKVTAGQFERFCRQIGAGLRQPSRDQEALFEWNALDALYVVDEHAIDSETLRNLVIERLEKSDVQTMFQAEAIAVEAVSEGIVVQVRGLDGNDRELETQRVYNCTYGGLNQIGGSFEGLETRLRLEATELPIFKVPEIFEDLAITILDGPFFSLFPFASKAAHTLSHVRYTPHFSWMDQRGLNPDAFLQEAKLSSRADRMLRSASRYLPALKNATYLESHFEIKSVLLDREVDDGRPILFEESRQVPGLYSILGSKLDNVYDVFHSIRKSVS